MSAFDPLLTLRGEPKFALVDYPILQQLRLADGSRIIVYDMPNSGARVVNNLVCELPNGTVRWIASPGRFGPDAFVAARIEGALVVANTWTGYALGLDLTSGREVSRTFTK